MIQLSPAPRQLDRTSGRVNVAAGDYGFWAFGATVQSAAANTNSDITASVGGSGRQGYITNTTLHDDVDSRDAVAGRLKWRYRPADGLELSLHVIGQRTRDGAQALVPLGGPYHEVERTKEGESDSDFAAGALGITRKLPEGTLTSTTSYSSFDLEPYNNRLVVFGGFDFDSAESQSQHTFAEEIHYTTDTYSGGFFYSNSRTKGATDRVFSGFPVELSGFTTDADKFALFGRANFTPRDGWVITPGLRVEYVAKDFTRTETIPTSQVYDRSNDWWAFLPSLTATRRFDATTDLSFTHARRRVQARRLLRLSPAVLTSPNSPRNATGAAKWLTAPARAAGTSPTRPAPTPTGLTATRSSAPSPCPRRRPMNTSWSMPIGPACSASSLNPCGTRAAT